MLKTFTGEKMFKTGVCIISRNDGYGGFLEERASININSALECYDYVYYIDWNSTTDLTLLEKIKDHIPKYKNIRQFKVSPQVATFLTKNQPAQKCCEVLARNIGIRRMCDDGIDYIVSSNIDIINPSKKDMNRFVEKYMNDNLFCTVSRRDINLQWSSKTWQHNVENFYKKPVIENLRKNYYRYPCMPPNDEHYHAALISYCGDFQIAHRNVWSKIKGFEESLLKRGYTDVNVQLKAYHAGVPLFVYYHLPVFHINHGLGGYGGNSDNHTLDKKKDFEYRHYVCTQLKLTSNSDNWGFPNLESIVEI